MTSERRSVAPSDAEELAIADLIEEFVARLQTGESISAESFAAEHPAYAEKLRGLLPGVQVLADLEPSESDADSENVLAQSREGILSGVLGDFRIFREVGRGGMGVVYEAEQISLRRRVALKVLSFAATMDARHLQRFRNEVQAAACLHHTNIVPVHAVGCERGVHYYAMQFIEGLSLDVFLRRQRRAVAAAEIEDAERTTDHSGAESASPLAGTTVQTQAKAMTKPAPHDAAYFRRVAEWGIAAAEALEHAHSLGIVHRDIKPANLLIDATGRLWITDFGLARLGSDAGLTLSGDVLGTLRYMSPEQAMAKHGLVDHRTDVYSLGVTLYELLTLRPAIDGDDREELRRKIASEEPVLPRRLNKAIPVDLEIVVGKAMAKELSERFATAQEFAEDLRHWLEDRPIRARRPPLRARLARWGRRHKPLVAAVVAALLISSTVLAASIGWVAHDRAARRAKNQEAVAAALEESVFWQKEGRLSEALSAARRADGLFAAAEMDESCKEQVRTRLDDLKLLTSLENILVERMTAIQDGRFDTEGADALYGQTFREAGLDVEALSAEVAAERIRTSTVAVELAAVLDKWAKIRRTNRGAGDPSWKALLYVAQLADPDVLRNRVRKILAARDLQALREVSGAEEAFQLSTALLTFLGFALLDDKETRGHAETFWREAQRRRPNDFWVNEDLYWFLTVFEPSQREDAIRFATAGVALRPQSPGAHNNLGSALHLKGRLDEAIAEYREAIRLKNDYPGAHCNLGKALRDKGRLDAAITEYRAAIRLKNDFALAHLNLGCALAAQGQLDQAIAEYREAIRHKHDFAEAHYDLGNALHGKGQLDEAIAEYREAIRLKTDYPEAHDNRGGWLLFSAIGDTRHKNNYPEAHNNLGNALRDKGRLDDSIAEYRTAIRFKKDFAFAHYDLGSALAVKGQLDEAIAEFREAIRFQKDYANAYCNLGQALIKKGQFRQAVDALRRGHQLGSQDPRWSHPSAQWLRNAERLADLDSRLPALLKGETQPKDTGERVTLAQICQLHKKLYAASARWYGEAFAAQPDLADNLTSRNRYNAACAAALAGCSQGEDVAGLDDEQRLRLRRQALDWLRADLQAWRRLLAKDPEKVRPILSKKLRHWQNDPDLAGVRGGEALAKLPQAERTEWRRLWQELEALHHHAAAPPKTTDPNRTNDGSQQGQPGR